MKEQNHFYLIRHGTNDFVGNTIVGRKPGVHLNEKGKQQAELLIRLLGAEPITRLITSPLERTQETAAPLARKLGLAVATAPELLEIDFGDWTGKSLTELNAMPAWRDFDSFRSGRRIPNGEHMIEAQGRVVNFIDSLRRQFPGEAIVLVSHADTIRAALVYYLGMPMDFLHRLEISPGSVSLLALGGKGAQLVYLNRTWS